MPASKRSCIRGEREIVETERHDSSGPPPIPAGDDAPQEIQRVLIVDDTPANVKLLDAILKQSGFETIIAVDGEDALQKVADNSVDIVLLDIMMPKLNGYEVCARLRSQEATAGLPIIMITALQGLQEKVQGLEVGADDFITKPFQKVELMARVRSLLRVKSLRDRLALANKSLADRNRLLEMELTMARTVQQALLPQSPPMIPGFLFAHKYLPATVVGGDFFDILRLGEKRAGVFVADVSGHGVRAALIMAIVKTLLGELRDRADSPGKLLTEMNRRFKEILGQNAPLIFVTAVYVVIDAKDGSVTIGNAGHPPPILLRRSTGAASLVPADASPDPALGFVPGFQYGETRCPAQPDDVVLAFTDGLFEVWDESGRELGEKQLLEMVATGASEPLPRLVVNLVEQARQFAGSKFQRDDINIVAAQILA